MADRSSLSVFFPCYNEEGNLERVVGEALDFLPAVSDDFEIIIGSGDRTGEIARRLAAADPRIRAIHHDSNMGYGAALRSGFAAATKQLVFYTDGDGQFDIRELSALLPLARRCDIVSGYRINRRDSVVRRLNAFLWGKLVQALLRFRCRDVDCAFKLYRRSIFDRMDLKSTGALIDAEILARAARAGCTIGEVPVHHKPRLAGQQTGGKIAVILRAFRELVELRGAILSSPRD
jgi:glycosyltransferase involved in cell wall biosynthesis